ncbi:MAG TPA: UvrD-helicase domain-containing protein [Planktothrix sp.]
MPGLTEQQQLASTKQAHRILVSAGAGSGKTHVLVERYIEKLRLDPELSIGQLIAVTFTRKAASEMRIRLKIRLRELYEQSCDAERERWSRCVSEIDGARIGTIHSLCESIIRTFPLDAEVDPQLDVLDDLAQARLIEESIDQAFREAISEQSPEHELLLEFDLPQIRRWIAATLKAATQFEEAIAPVQNLDVEQFKQHAAGILLQARKRALSAITSDIDWKNAVVDLERSSPDEMTQALDLMRLAALRCVRLLQTFVHAAGEGEVANELVEASWQSVIELTELKPGNSGGNKEGAKATRAAMRNMRSLCGDRTARLPAGLNEADERAFSLCAGFITLSRRAQRLYDVGKREQLTADYNDLIALALKALTREGSSARRFYNDSVVEILVDEFQDTNRAQSKLLNLLAGDRATIFMIGDDKQSIYKFQGADVSIFNECKTSIAAEDKEALLSLSRSFRSHPQVVGFVNWLFSQLMGGNQDAFSASFEALDVARSADEIDRERVEVIVYSTSEADSYLGRQENSRRTEAARVADWILDKVAGEAPVEEKSGKRRPIRFGDFAILVQRNKDFAWLEDAFIKANIPYVMLGGRGFLERQEIFDMENFLSFLSSPADDHALFGILRSPIYAVSDHLLHAMAAGRSGSLTLWQALSSAARQRKPGYEAVRNAVSSLKRFLEESRKLCVSEVLRNIIARTGYDIVLLGLPNGKQRSRNLWKLVALASEKDEMSCGEFASTLRLMREFNVQKTDAPLDTRDSVKLITIHSSKGLEFPAVILPVLDVNASARNDRLVFHREYGLAINTSRSDEDEKPAWYDVACSINNEMELAEKQRLFYVAATRARDYLGIFMDADARNVPSFRTWLKEKLGLNQQGDCATPTQSVCSVTYLEAEEADVGEDDSDFFELTKSVSIDVGGSQADETHRRGTLQAPAARLLQRLADASGGTDSEPPISLSWDLIWPSMSGELVAPPADSGVRITLAPTRKHLESTRFGTYFHALMENLPQDLRPLTLEEMRSIAFSQGEVVADTAFLDQLVEDGKRLYDIFLASDLFSNLQTARRRLNELPYMYGSDSIHTKRPDLIFEDAAGNWHIVDYKTDFVQGDDTTASMQKHSAQLSEYINELNKLTGLIFTPWVYFAQLGKLVEVKAPSAPPAPAVAGAAIQLSLLPAIDS